MTATGPEDAVLSPYRFNSAALLADASSTTEGASPASVPPPWSQFWFCPPPFSSCWLSLLGVSDEKPLLVATAVVVVIAAAAAAVAAIVGVVL